MGFWRKVSGITRILLCFGLILATSVVALGFLVSRVYHLRIGTAVWLVATLADIVCLLYIGISGGLRSSKRLNEAYAKWPKMGRWRQTQALGLEDVVARVDAAKAKDEPPSFKLCLLPAELIFDGQSLRGADFCRASLFKVDFTDSDLSEARFFDANLHECDLSQTKGLTVEQLSGADLTRTKLPADIAAFPQLATIADLSKNSGALYLSTVLACGFLLTTAITTKDIQLLTGGGVARIPVVNVSVPTLVFFTVTPAIVLSLVIAVHLYLQRLWEAMAWLPAFFPSGDGIEFKTYPWLFNDLIRLTFPLLIKSRGVLALLLTLAYCAIAYLVVPITLLAVYFRCLARHDNILSTCHLICFAVSVAVLGYRLVHPLRRMDLSGGSVLEWTRKILPWGLILGMLFLVLSFGHQDIRLAITGISGDMSQSQMRAFIAKNNPKGVLTVMDRLVQAARDYRELKQKIGVQNLVDRNVESTFSAISRIFDQERTTKSPLEIRLLNRSVFSGFGNVEEDHSARTAGWKEPTYADRLSAYQEVLLAAPLFVDRSSEVERRREWIQVLIQSLRTKASVLSWRGNQRFMRARSAFLGNSDFRSSDLTGADLAFADLRCSEWGDYSSAPIVSTGNDSAGVNRAQMRFVILHKCLLTGSMMKAVDLRGADLSNADFGASTLSFSRMVVANCSETNFTYADLQNAQLTGADLSLACLDLATLGNANFCVANLSDVKCYGSNLDGANLQGATIQRAHLVSTSLTGAHLDGADLNSCILDHSKLNGARLRYSDCNSAHFEQADLSEADFTGADLRNVDMTGANLTGVILDRAMYSSNSMWKIPPSYQLEPRRDPTGNLISGEFILKRREIGLHKG